MAEKYALYMCFHALHYSPRQYRWDAIVLFEEKKGGDLLFKNGYCCETREEAEQVLLEMKETKGSLKGHPKALLHHFHKRPDQGDENDGRRT